MIMFAPVYILLGYLDNIETKLKVVHNSKLKKKVLHLSREIWCISLTQLFFLKLSQFLRVSSEMIMEVQKRINVTRNISTLV